jgi:hypothetical protein
MRGKGLARWIRSVLTDGAKIPINHAPRKLGALKQVPSAENEDKVRRLNMNFILGSGLDRPHFQKRGWMGVLVTILVAFRSAA